MFRVKSNLGYLAKHPKINSNDARRETHYWTWRIDVALSFQTSEEAFNYGDQHSQERFRVA